MTTWYVRTYVYSGEDLRKGEQIQRARRAVHLRLPRGYPLHPVEHPKAPADQQGELRGVPHQVSLDAMSNYKVSPRVLSVVPEIVGFFYDCSLTFRTVDGSGHISRVGLDEVG